MKISSIQIVVLLLIVSAQLFGQEKVILVRKHNLSRQAVITFDRKFEIKTMNEYYKSDIINFHDGHFTIIQHNLKKDTSIQIGSIAKPIYNWMYDTLKIPFNQIEYIKAYRYKNRDWTIPFVLVAVATVGSVFFTPLVSATKGKVAAGKMTIIQLGLVAVTLPPIIIGTRKVKYDLKNKWKLKTIE